MQIKDLIFFTICSIMILSSIIVSIGIATTSYIKDYISKRESNILSYIGGGTLIAALIGLFMILIILLLSIMFGIDDYTMNYLNTFLKSDFFKTIVLSLIISAIIYFYFLFKYYSFIDVIYYRNINDKIDGIEDALEHSQKALEKIEKEIKNIKKEKTSDRLLKELNDNKKSLEKVYENYLIKYKHLENIKVKLLAKIKENNIDI